MSKAAAKSKVSNLESKSTKPATTTWERNREPFLAMIQKQEDAFVKAGFDVEGVTDLIRRWWDGWDSFSVEAIRETISDDMVYNDPTTGNVDIVTSVDDVAFIHLLLKTVHKHVYYVPVEGENAMPLWDVTEGNVRIAVAYRAVGRIWPLRSFDEQAVDRYSLKRDPKRGWVISRIDTRADFLWAIGRILPIRVRPPSPASLRRLTRAVNFVFPSMRGPKVRPFHGSATRS